MLRVYQPGFPVFSFFCVIFPEGIKLQSFAGAAQSQAPASGVGGGMDVPGDVGLNQRYHLLPLLSKATASHPAGTICSPTCRVSSSSRYCKRIWKREISFRICNGKPSYIWITLSFNLSQKSTEVESKALPEIPAGQKN